MNKFVGEQLRCMIASAQNLRTQWAKIIKYIEFNYRRMPIPGTDVTPFMLARGRTPLLPTDADLVDDYFMPVEPMPIVEERLREKLMLMELSRRMVIEAREKAMQKNQERFDLTQHAAVFDVGTVVRLFNKVPATKDPATGEMRSSKLKLDNSLWRVARREGQIYGLISESTGAEREAHVSQIAQYYPVSEQWAFDEPNASVDLTQPAPTVAEALPAIAGEPKLSQEAMRKLIRRGSYIIFHYVHDSKDIVTMGEVTRFDEDHELHVWYMYDANQADNIKAGKVYNRRKPLKLWNTQPEWNDRLEYKLVPNPSEQQKVSGQLVKHIETFTTEEYEVIVPSFDSWRKVGGELQPALTRRVDAWLRRQSLTPKQLKKVLSEPTHSELTAAEIRQKKSVTDGTHNLNS